MDFGGQAFAAVGGGFIGGVVGVVTGAIIGASVGGERAYDISEREHTQKVEIIGALMSR